jgi:isopentenyldiphosphate isomerase
VNAHLHLSVAYVFEAKESESLIMNKEETSGLKWVPIELVQEHSGEEAIIYVYRKLFNHVGIKM